MAHLSRFALGVVAACCAGSAASAGPSLSILYHESIRPELHQVTGRTREMEFDAFGRRFQLRLKPNAAVSRAVPADRQDIEALAGRLEGQPLSWARLTRTRRGWQGLVSDGNDVYAIEPAANLTGSLVQPSAALPGYASVMYRLRDALIQASPALCSILNTDGTPYVGADALPIPDSRGRVNARAMLESIVRDASASTGPHLQLTLGVLADNEFYRNAGSDPEGEIVSRVNMVDGIWSSQIGLKITLGPLTVWKSATEPFDSTDPNTLLRQVRDYRGSHSDQMATGVTHLITGRNLDGDIVGISYMNSVCEGSSADSLSEGLHSSLMSSLIMAHELGHNFNAPHDGEAGACSSTPQTYLMAPKINFSTQFSSCSVQQIQTRMQSAQCLTPYQAPDVAVELPADSISAVAGTPFTLSFDAVAAGDDPSVNVSANATLPAALTIQSATAAAGTCTISGGSVTCALGTLTPAQSVRIELKVVGAHAGNSSASVSVTSTNDSVAANDAAQVSIQLAAPPTAPVTGGSGDASHGGGGGGGSLDWLLLASLAGLGGVRARRRRN